MPVLCHVNYVSLQPLVSHVFTTVGSFLSKDLSLGTIDLGLIAKKVIKKNAKYVVDNGYSK